MMQVCRCDFCNKELSFPWGHISAEINLKRHEWCDKCGKSSEHNTHYSFCDTGCMVEFMSDIINGQRELKLP